MKIKRILNNNAVICFDEHGEETIIKGKGLAYGCNAGDEIDANKIEKIFVLENKETQNRYQQLLADTPMDCIEACEKMVDLIKEQSEKEISDQIYITLTDHIFNLLERIKMGIVFDHALLWDVKRLYRKEYQIGLQVVDCIRTAFDVKVDDEEAGFVALHIVNAQMHTQLHEVLEITSMIDSVYDIVESDFSLKIDQDSLEYTRFIMHLRVFFERIINHQSIQEEKSKALLDSLVKEYDKQYQCVLKILKFVSMKYSNPLQGEILYLLVHIIKLTD